MSSKPVRRFTAILLGLILAQLTAPQAFGATLRSDASALAHIQASAPATPGATGKARKTAKTLASLDARTYRQLVRVHQEAIRSINETFTVTVREARTVYRDARAAAKTAAAKADAAARYNDAVTAATEARQQALDALPALPPPPPGIQAPRPSTGGSPTPTAAP